MPAPHRIYYHPSLDTPEKREAAAARIDAGEFPGKVAEDLGTSVTTVKRVYRKLRGTHLPVRKAYSEETRQQIEREKNAGASVNSLAAKYKLNPSTVFYMFNDRPGVGKRPHAPGTPVIVAPRVVREDTEEERLARWRSRDANRNRRRRAAAPKAEKPAKPPKETKTPKPKSVTSPSVPTTTGLSRPRQAPPAVREEPPAPLPLRIVFKADEAEPEPQKSVVGKLTHGEASSYAKDLEHLGWRAEAFQVVDYSYVEVRSMAVRHMPVVGVLRTKEQVDAFIEQNGQCGTFGAPRVLPVGDPRWKVNKRERERREKQLGRKGDASQSA